MNLQLKSALVGQFGTQADAAYSLGLQESRLSRLVRGRIQPCAKDWAAFVRVFGEAKADRLLNATGQPENRPGGRRRKLSPEAA